MICSLPNLTRLSLSDGYLDCPIWEENVNCEIPHVLQEFRLDNMELSWEWYKTAFQPLKGLQVLELVSCPVQKRKLTQLHPVDSLR